MNGAGTVRARLGYAFSPAAMLYVTGGYQFGNFKVNDYALATSTSVSANGYVLGLGGEYKLTRNWSAFAEYRYSGVKASGLTGTAGVNQGLLGVNYRF